MANLDVHFSRASNEWETPRSVFEPLDREFGFDIDVAATLQNAQTRPCLTMDDDALQSPWGLDGRGRVCWMNPPYSKCLQFMEKAATEVAGGCTVVALMPARTDTRWWHRFVWDNTHHCPRRGVEVRFVQGRIRFHGARAGAPFPSVIIVMRPVAS